VRPFKLILLGPSPLEWFEFELEIYVSFGVRYVIIMFNCAESRTGILFNSFVIHYPHSIEIGLFLGPIEVTIWDYSYGVSIELIEPLLWRPSVEEIATYSGGEMQLKSATSLLKCMYKTFRQRRTRGN
jgi:hypothetical protein